MKSTTIFMYALGAIIVIGFFVVLYALIVQAVPENNSEILYIMLGILGSSFSLVVGYFYGSSAGSNEKTRMLVDKK